MMIDSELGHVTTLEEFHSEIKRQQEENHGAHYCDIHDAIQKYMKECTSYMELGTHQGGTASAALLCKPKFVQLVDIDMRKYRKFLSPIAEKYARENNIELKVKEVDSRGLGSLAAVDMLVIDSVHKPPFMTEELNNHHNNIKKYIIAHDTAKILNRPNNQLYKVLENFASNGQWKIIEHGTDSVGYTVLKRISNE